MLQLLTKYLLRYKKVSIPHVGTIELVGEPARLNFADKLMLPPGFKAEISREESLPAHQLHYLAMALDLNIETVRQELILLGQKIKTGMASGNFTWNGIGRFSASVTSSCIECPLQPVPAEKPLRENIDHIVLAGDQPAPSHELAAVAEQKHRRSKALLIGWIVFGLSLAFIAYLLYTGKFSVYTSGLKSRP